MALFRSTSPTSPTPMATSRAPANPAEQHNIVGASTTIEGTVRSEGNVNVSGTVNGDVEVEGRTMVMPGGVIEGEVTTTTAEVAGTVRGRLTVRERLVLKASAVIEGDIVIGKLVVEDGAAFNGECRMGRAANDAPSRGHAATRAPAGGRRRLRRRLGRRLAVAKRDPYADRPDRFDRADREWAQKWAAPKGDPEDGDPDDDLEAPGAGYVPGASTPGAIQDAYGDGMRAAGEHIGLGVQIGASMLFFIGVGIVVDRWLGTEPWGVIVGAVLGMVGVVALVMRVAKGA